MYAFTKYGFYCVLACVGGFQIGLHQGVVEGVEGCDLDLVCGEVVPEFVGSRGVGMIGETIPVYSVVAVDDLDFMSGVGEEWDEVGVGDPERDVFILGVLNLEIGPVFIICTAINEMF